MAEMKQKDFDRLKASIIEAGKINRGETEPAQVTVLELSEANRSETQAFAVCIDTDDRTLLIPRKLYPVTLYDNKFVRVVDEAGEATIYPASFFLPVSLAREVENALAKIA